MDDLLSEKEQIEQIRSWWKEYGAWVIGGIVIGAGLLFGYNYYKSSQLQAQLEASTAYETLIEHVVDGDLDAAKVVAADLASNYPSTVYVGQAGLAMAKLYMDKNRDQDAADALAAVIDSDVTTELKQVARVRLARIYLYQDKAQDVVDMLAGQPNTAFSPVYNEILGDAYTALGQTAEAQDAYQKALTDPLARGVVDQQLVQWKSLDLPEIEAAAEMAEPQADAPVEAEEPATEEAE